MTKLAFYFDCVGNYAVFKTDNQQGPPAEHREPFSILCKNLMVTEGKDEGKE